MASSKKTKTAGPWTTAARRKLSAIRVPQPCDPPDFTWDAATAPAELKRRAATGQGAIEDVPEEPTVLTVESETARVRAFASWVGTVDGLNNWGPGGRSFTDEAWNPLVGLWLARGGWDLVFALIAPDPANPMKNDLGSTDKSAPWYALRRYLHRAPAAEYAALKDRFEPAFRKLFEATKCAAAPSPESREQREGRDHLAFAFDRDTGWPEELLNDFVSSSLAGPAAQKRAPDLNLMLAVCPDPELTARAFARRGFPPRDAFHVFDLVETAGAKAIPLLRSFEARDAGDRKRIAAALAIAEKLG